MNSLKYRGIIFDLDGTLACTLPDLFSCMNRMLESEGYPLQTKESLMTHINCGVYDFVKYSLPVSVQDDEELIQHCIDVYEVFYKEHCCDGSYLYEGIEEIVDRLKSDGAYLAVNTNKEEHDAAYMVEKLIPGRFSIVSGDLVFPHKPDPSGALHIASESGIPPEEFIYIGDSDVDMKTAVNAGMHPVGVSWGYNPVKVMTDNGAEGIADSAYELLKFLYPTTPNLQK